MNKIWLGVVVGLCAIQMHCAVSKEELKKKFARRQQVAECIQILMQKLQQAGKNIENKNMQEQILHACVDWRRQGYDPVEVAQNVQI